ncbi:MAG: hypothetical protein WC683_04615 [bacterium]
MPDFLSNEEAVQAFEDTLNQAAANEDELLADIEKSATISDKAKNAVRASLRMLSAYKDEIGEQILKSLAAAAGFGHGEAVTKSAEDIAAEIKKSVDEGVAAQVAEITKSADEKVAAAEGKVAGLEHQVAVKERAATIAAQFPHLPGKPEERAEIILKAEATDPKVAEELQKSWEREEAMTKAATGEIGKDSAGANPPGSVVEDVMARANALVEKSEGGKLPFDQALAKVFADEPALYDKYRAEKIGGR